MILNQPVFLGLKTSTAVYLGAFLSTPIFAFLVQRDKWAAIILAVFGVIALGYLFMEMMKSTKVERERLQVVLIFE